MSNQKQSKKVAFLKADGVDVSDEDREVEQAERHASEEVIHQHVTEIWGYVRNHADSLDADKHCRKITEVVTRLVQHMQKRIETLAMEQQRDRKKLAVRDKQLRDSKKPTGKRSKQPAVVKGSNMATYVKETKTKPTPPIADMQSRHRDIL